MHQIQYELGILHGRWSVHAHQELAILARALGGEHSGFPEDGEPAAAYPHNGPLQLAADRYPRGLLAETPGALGQKHHGSRAENEERLRGGCAAATAVLRQDRKSVV